ncbi:MAG TPA: YtxH domain-containing protein [Acidobacteriaceae bacterium]|nr:YtxH domain-containing protein [Acidobacteriaceae bacterium]
MSAVRYWTVFSLGVVAGAAVALIYAPQTGDKTRKQLKRNLNDASDYLRDTSDDLSKHAKRVIKKTKDVVDDVSTRVSSVADKVSDLV